MSKDKTIDEMLADLRAVFDTPKEKALKKQLAELRVINSDLIKGQHELDKEARQFEDKMNRYKKALLRISDAAMCPCGPAFGAIELAKNALKE